VLPTTLITIQMVIDINQKEISMGDKYRIYVREQETYIAKRQIFQLLPEIKLFLIDTDVPRLTINKKFAWFKAKYDITRMDGSVLDFRTISYWKSYYQCQNGVDTYDIYGHRGRKYSIYKNNIQIAFWDKEAVVWFEGDNYKIKADKDCDVELLISFCLIVDNFSSENHGGNVVTYDLGNFGFQAKKFDESWRSKN
jgi:hypothetical protein